MRTGGAEEAIGRALGADALAAMTPVRRRNASERIAVIAAAEGFSLRKQGKLKAFLRRAQFAGWKLTDRKLLRWRTRFDMAGVAGLVADGRGSACKRRSVSSLLWAEYRRLRDAGMSRPRAQIILAEKARAAGLWFPCLSTLQTWARTRQLPQLLLGGAA
jgi:hypothetical protein